jgi:hypothetical protein
MKIDIRRYENFLTQRRHTLLLWEVCSLLGDKVPLKLPARKRRSDRQLPKAA